MAINPAELSILHYPAPVLRTRAKSIAKIDDDVRAVAERMIELMQEAKGLGLAAPQVGVPWRMFVTNVPEDDQIHVYINPTLTNFGGEMDVVEEGCLSLPGIHVDVSRPTAVTLTATALNGEPISRSSDDFQARVWQHEFDHLNGVLIIDRLSAAERLALRQEMKMKSAFGG